MTRRVRFLLSSAFILALIIMPGIASAQTPDIDTSAEHTFGESVTIYALVHTDMRVLSASIFIRALEDTYTHVGTPDIDQINGDLVELYFLHSLHEHPLPAFSTVKYRYDITFENGKNIKSPWYSFYYDDNRYQWQELVEGPFKVNWYDGDLEFAQKIQDTAQEGLNKIHSVLRLPIPNPLEIYIYPDPSTMQTALNPASATWVAGHADPKQGVIVVSLPEGPDRLLLMEQRIPHELMHIALYEYAEIRYDNLPVWFKEGLAAHVELYPNPDYRVMLEYAKDNDSLIPLSNLCKSFPPDATSALLAYAQSASFTSYLIDTYGTEGMGRLVTEYANGLDCDSGARVALRRSLAQLERQWRAELLNENLTLTAFNNLLPWLIIMLVVLAAPLGLALYYTRARKAQDTSKDLM